MLALQITFPAGRYHANPWGRHVNEGEVAWPPEAWRLTRALIATWHHKVKNTGRYSEASLHGLIDALASALPQYHLPAGNHSHTRHYLPQWKAGDTSLVFDAFVAVDRETPLYMYWPGIDLIADQAELLDDLLSVIGYLGRAESWVEAKRITTIPKPPNCVPGNDPIDRESGELLGELISLQSPLTATEYAQRRTHLTTDKRQKKKLATTLPEGLVAALSIDTADLHKLGWSQPPASRQVSYLRPLDALRPQRHRGEPPGLVVTTASFLLIGKPLPRVEDSLRIGELARRAVMAGFSKDDQGKNLAPPHFSGHDLPEENRHQHAFYLPYDSNGDGRLDRLLIHVPAGFSGDDRRVIERLRKLWQAGGNQWRLLIEGIGAHPVGGRLLASSTNWVSVTPYLHPWHVKKTFSVQDQIRRECRERGLPAPTRIAPASIRINGQERRPIHFHRFRSKRGLTQPDRHGGFWQIEFPEPVTGPLALGFSCHFGLGLFAPME